MTTVPLPPESQTTGREPQTAGPGPRTTGPAPRAGDSNPSATGPGPRPTGGASLPGDRADGDAPGHSLLARLGKRVLRPGGAELTRVLLARAEITGADVVEFAPGLGRTAREILDRHPRSYLGVEQDPVAVAAVGRVVAGHGTAVLGDAAATGLPDASADVVIGEAMLTMRSDWAKDTVVAEAARLLRPGGRYAIHELGLTPDSLPEPVKTGIRQALARAVKVNARPQTITEWRSLLQAHGLVVERVDTAPMALLRPRRIVADEGPLGALRFVRNLLANPDARRRVLAMRRTFRLHRDHLIAVAVIARKPSPDP
ncbi:methyltransferase domain-containing protein [Streptosporangium sp. NPDC002721]|uniref:class I SAM-dependent methyltransferase n=1 Tax=Streptosporangium sp. NPDC002721 TaxID=3366188 RepID=UPI0036B7C865